MSKTRRFLLILLGMYVALVGLTVVLAPLRSDSIETAVTIAALSSIPLVVGLALPVLMLNQMWRQRPLNRQTGLAMFALFVVFGAAIYFPYVKRNAHAALLRPALDGVLVQRFNSSNHQLESIEVRSKNGSISVLENIDHSTWQSLNAGDSVQKDPWSPYAKVNGQKVRLVPPGLLDSLRGVE